MRKKALSQGQSLIEFALILPILLMLVMGLFDIGRFVLYYAVLNTAVREGTRFAIVQPYEDYDTYPGASFVLSGCGGLGNAAYNNICQEINDKTFSINDLSATRVSITHGENDNEDPVINIGLEFDYSPITPGLGLISNFTIEVDSEMLLTAKAKNDSGG